MNYNVETAVEDAFVNLLSGFNETSGTKIVRWEDINDIHLSPSNLQTVDVIKVMVTDEFETEGLINTYLGMDMSVDIGVFCSKRKDTNARKVNELVGSVRSFLGQPDVVDQINALSGCIVYENGVIPQGGFDISDDKNYGKGITVRVIAAPK